MHTSSRGALTATGASSSPRVSPAAEWWAHCRNHSAGHQLHFDSAFEGLTVGGAENPLVSTVLYLGDEEVGGPTLVTSQRLKDTTMARSGYLVRPKENRLCLFEGDLLHGVLPGRGAIPGAARRSTLLRSSRQ